MRTLSKFYVLTWKNLLLKRRHWFMTVLELVIPVLLFVLLAVLRAELNLEDIEADFKARTYEASDMFYDLNKVRWHFGHEFNSYEPCGDNLTMLYTAPTDQMEQADNIVNEMTNFVNFACSMINQGDDHLMFVKTDSEESIEAAFINSRAKIDAGNGENPILGGIIFQSDTSGSGNFLYQIRYGAEPEDIESRTGDLFSEFSLANPYESCHGWGRSEEWDCVEKKYRNFVTIQNMVEYAHIQLVTNIKTFLPTSKEDLCSPDMLYGQQAMPVPSSKFEMSMFTMIQGFLTPIFTIISFAFTVPLVLKRIVEEKQQGVKELMKMMGLPSWLHWAGWFFITIIVSVITISVMVMVLKIGKILPEVDPLVLFFSLFFYSLSLMCFNFALSTLFSNPNLAVALGIVLHFGSWIAGASLVRPEDYFTWSTGSKLALALIPNLGFQSGFVLIYMKEADGSGGMKWGSVAEAVNASDTITMLHIWLAHLISCGLFTILLWYIDNVRPGKFGVAQKLYFPFQKSYWCGEPQDLYSEDSKDMTDKKLFEDEPNTEKGVEVNGLRKVFRGRKNVVAVNDVTFNAYNGDITALLGHNGAGKTTTMSMLTGLFSPTSGDARINGFNIKSDMEKARESLGLCPQHNMLFPSLTVYEHLIFFGMLKGISHKQAKQDGNFYINSLNLSAKKNVSSTALSGGMKRKLHLAMALTGPSKVLILDEPTSGMDPEARRGMWDVLQNLKEGRTIMLTTHFMEEADVLGDRIAIMADGKVKCCGSPMFLKSNLGSGYTLTITKESSASSEKLLSLVKTHVKNASIKNENSLEIIIGLDDDNAGKISALASELDKSKELFGYTSFGFSKATIEDVFLKVGEGREIHETQAKSSADNMYQEYQVTKIPKVKGSEILLNHFKGLFTKRMVSTLRMWKTYFFLSLFSFALFIILGYIANNPIRNRITPSPALSLSATDLYDTENIFLIDHLVVGDFANGLTGYLDILKEKHDQVANITDELLQYASDDVFAFSRKRLLGVTLQEYKIYEEHLCPDQNHAPTQMMTGLYNPIPFHARPLMRNIMNNVILRINGKTSRIIASSKPLVYRKNDIIQIDEDQNFNFTPVQYMTATSMGMALLLGIFIIFPLKERVTNAKQVQIMAGVNPFVFWISNFAWDFIIYLVISLLLALILYLFDTRLALHSNGSFGTLCFLFLLLGFAGIPFSYILSFPFKSSPAAYAILIITSIVTGVIAPMAIYFLRLFYDEDMKVNLKLISDIIRYILSWVGPFVPFGRAMMSFISVQETNNRCNNGATTEQLTRVCELFFNDTSYFEFTNNGENNNKTAACCDTEWGVPAQFSFCGTQLDGYQIHDCVEPSSYWTFDHQDGINIDVLILCADIVLFWVILVLIETNVIKIAWVKIKEVVYGRDIEPVKHVDDDVQLEKDSVFSEENLMKVLNLKKKFGNFEAVRGLTFGVRKKECFGLLGVNGAGKTTTFRMLTGDEIMTSGQAFIGRISLSGERSAYLQSIGYCPQFDSIIEVLSGREMLTLFSRIRGMRTKNNVITSEIEKLAKFVDLTQYLDRPCGQYSGGNKRKLNVALALIGRPKVMLLDEPTTGVDPAARRKIWETINNIRKSGTSIILTSHSMEECEALCDRLAIMVKGSFQCLGGPQHIKSKFGQGYQIIVKLDPRKSNKDEETLNAIKASVIQKFDKCVVTDEHMDYIHFHVGNPATPWSLLFSNMESVKKEQEIIQDYSISETTLEQIFLSFARGENIKITTV